METQDQLIATSLCRVSWVQVHQEHILLHSALHRDTASWGVIITQENVGIIGHSRADMKKNTTMEHN